MSSTSQPARVVERAIEDGQILGSTATLREVIETILSPKFDRMCRARTAKPCSIGLRRLSRWLKSSSNVRACRDPKDDKFPELAVNGAASVIVTGDDDLLSLHPFRGVDILSPAAYLERPGTT